MPTFSQIVNFFPNLLSQSDWETLLSFFGWGASLVFAMAFLGWITNLLFGGDK